MRFRLHQANLVNETFENKIFFFGIRNLNIGIFADFQPLREQNNVKQTPPDTLTHTHTFACTPRTLAPNSLVGSVVFILSMTSSLMGSLYSQMKFTVFKIYTENKSCFFAFQVVLFVFQTKNRYRSIKCNGQFFGMQCKRQ